MGPRVVEVTGRDRHRALAHHLAGGDAVIIDDLLQNKVSEMSHLHVWATVVKLGREPPPGDRSH